MPDTRPHDVLQYWIGPARNNPDVAREKNKLWFTRSDETDAEIRERFSATLDALASGKADDWAALGPHGRLAAIIVLDQFSRNLYRGRAHAFAQDAQALALCKRGILGGDDTELSEVERIFFYLPLEHAESPGEQEQSIEMFTKLHEDARPEFRFLTESSLDYAHAHKAVIDRFGRYPHRNDALGRESTGEEIAFIAEHGTGF